MKTLNEMLNAYLGDTTSSDAALTSLRMYSKEDVDRFIAIVGCVAELDVPVTAAFLGRTPPDRFEETARLARDIARSDSDPVPRFDAASLARHPERVQRAYRQLLNEVYELAVALKVAGVHFGAKECIHGEHGAVETWEQFCYYAHGHPDQDERVRIARQQIALLKS